MWNEVVEKVGRKYAYTKEGIKFQLDNGYCESSYFTDVYESREAYEEKQKAIVEAKQLSIKLLSKKYSLKQIQAAAKALEEV
jgi:hypothetical protein